MHSAVLYVEVIKDNVWKFVTWRKEVTESSQMQFEMCQCAAAAISMF